MSEIKIFNLIEIWGKTNPAHPLLYHMIDVAHTGQELLKSPAFGFVKRTLLTAMKCNPSQLINWIGYIFALHDIGKCHPEFQVKAPELIGKLKECGLPFPESSFENFYHSIYSGNWLRQYLTDLKWGEKPVLTMMYSILGHHGSFKPKEMIDHPKILREWEQYRVKIKDLLYGYFNPEKWTPVDFENHSTVGILVSGLLVLSDWIASNESFFTRSEVNKGSIEDFQNYCVKSKDSAIKAVNSLGFSQFFKQTDFKDFTLSSIVKIGNSDFTSLTLIQEICEKNIDYLLKSKLIIIEAAMGEGKTETALFIAKGLMKDQGGLYFALPTMATSNQMYDRVLSFLHQIAQSSKLNIQLVHGMSWMIDKISDRIDLMQEDTFDSYDWFKPKKRALLAPYGVGTIDQSLASVLWVKFGFLRLLGLAGKVLIIDEVHAYDAYMSTIFVRLLKWASALQIPVILLSATLPLSKKKALLNAYSQLTPFSEVELEKFNKYNPLITLLDDSNKMDFLVSKQESQSKKINLHLEFDSIENFEKITDLAISSALKDKCICVILNTVKNSQELYKTLERKCINNVTNEISIMLFHARFPVERRLEIENQVKKLYDKRSIGFKANDPNNPRPKRAILVATQVVEQSLDLDFDEIISEIAPIDLLIQRMGRLHRHKRPHRSCPSEIIFRILLPKINFSFENNNINFGLTERVYYRYILLKTVEILIDNLSVKNIVNIEFPKDIRFLIEWVYDQSLKNNRKGARIALEDLQEAYDLMEKELREDENQAKIYLIPPPNPKRFELSRTITDPFTEDDSKVDSFLFAKTRVGDRTRRFVLIENPDLEEVVIRETPPNSKIQERLMQKSVSLPIYWFKGSKSKLQSLKWLSSSYVLKLEKNKYEYMIEDTTKKRIIFNHPIYGVYMEEV